jgi:hypothetical protein
VRSGLIGAKLWPSLVDLKMTLLPMYSVFGLCGEMTIG